MTRSNAVKFDRGTARRVGVALAIAVALGTVAFGATSARDGSVPSEWQQVRAAVARYHSFAQAQRDGYTVEGEPCVSEPSMGTMGIHAINPALLADEVIDPLRPEILLYLPRSDGDLELIGVEYWKADADGDLTTDADRPSVLGHPLDGPMPGHNPVMPVHYDLHVWVAEANPAGLFAPFNPAVHC
jgi:hypothetical protein